MEALKNGWYSVAHEGVLQPAYWDGSKWKTFDGKEHEKKNHNPIPIGLSCPLGCTCTHNDDGTINVNCT